jgi:hypothetical protein
MVKYEEFLRAKGVKVYPVGFSVAAADMNPLLFDWQRDVVAWALSRGRAALFEDCGLGKTPQQLEWARHVCAHTGGNVLILAPLAVASQTQREGIKFAVPVTICRDSGDVRPGVNIANYERLHRFSPGAFVGIVLDESSILKSFDGITRKAIQEFVSGIRYRLACTATPAPNDLTELTNHSEFVDAMSGKEILATFFRQDGNTSHAWRLKGHAREPFWKWLAEWSVAVRRPSDLGYDDGPFILPKLSIHHLTVGAAAPAGFLFSVEAQTLTERRAARRASLADRVAVTAGLINESTDTWLVWCDLNAESEALTRAIDGAVEVRGTDTLERKEAALESFSAGGIRCLVTKPSIAGWGMNWQHCANVAFVGLSDSYEAYYQAVRRCWRFGQRREVNVYVIASEAEGSVVANIERKERQAASMFENIVSHMNVHQVNRRQERQEMQYRTDEQKGETWRMLLGDSCERVREIQDCTVGLSVFSPPFPGMYAYTNSPRDVGNCSNIGELIAHFGFLMGDMLRITMPGRMCCVHLTQEPVFKGRDGFIGLRDFRGDCIRAMQASGWQYFSEVTIDKNPMLKASRTKESTLLFKTMAADSACCRPALADYLLIFRAPGDNASPIAAGTHDRWNPDAGWITPDEWCEWAAPVWYRAMPTIGASRNPPQPNYPSRHQETDGIRETDVLSTCAARDQEDEKHLCPLQLGVIERCVKLWSAPGDLVFSPFAGIGSEGYQSLILHRQFLGIELKESYWRVACANLNMAEKKVREDSQDLFSSAAAEPVSKTA